ncbi:hypothetical protein VTN49DRAFT_4504 [Thermomyces lanuginosus]|uniref:uncharacterized protein n=1 Tax=Thermomyces lanuginosus TaxID=5541 RepID=UPI00374388EF
MAAQLSRLEFLNFWRLLLPALACQEFKWKVREAARGWLLLRREIIEAPLLLHLNKSSALSPSNWKFSLLHRSFSCAESRSLCAFLIRRFLFLPLSRLRP